MKTINQAIPSGIKRTSSQEVGACSNESPQTANKKFENSDLEMANITLAASKLWPLMTAMYDHKFTKKFGEQPHPAWVSCLRGISPTQMANGLKLCMDEHPVWPPAAAEFRSLCLSDGSNPTPQGNPFRAGTEAYRRWEKENPFSQRTAAYRDIRDPLHPMNNPESPEYCPRISQQRALPSETSKDKANNEISKMKNLVKGI